MGLMEASCDGVRVEKLKSGTIYYPRCFFCLSEVRSWSYISAHHYVCPRCKPLIKSFKDYYNDKESRTLFEAISREAQAERAHPDL